MLLERTDATCFPSVVQSCTSMSSMERTRPVGSLIFGGHPPFSLNQICPPSGRTSRIPT